MKNEDIEYIIILLEKACDHILLDHECENKRECNEAVINILTEAVDLLGSHIGDKRT